MNRKRAVTAILAMAILAGTPAAASAARVITMSGSTSVAPLSALLAKKYITVEKGIKFKIAQGGSDIGVADVAAGRVTIGASSRDPKPTDPGGITFNKIAKDAICIVTNPGNQIANFDQATIQAIFSGKVTDWSKVPGSSLSGPIDLNVRTPASGTQDAFQKIFMGTAKVASSAAQKASNGLIQQSVQDNKNAIGYVSLDFVSGTNPVGYKGVTCDLRNAKSGEYGGVRNFWYVTRGTPKGPVAKFLKWVQENPVAQKIVGKHWVPLI
jgi:phosphate transport system substrate-binding protein